MQNVKSQIAALESQFPGKMVYHNYGQIGFGVVTGIDDRDPLKLRLRVKFTRHNTPEHIKNMTTGRIVFVASCLNRSRFPVYVMRITTAQTRSKITLDTRAAYAMILHRRQRCHHKRG